MPEVEKKKKKDKDKDKDKKKDKTKDKEKDKDKKKKKRERSKSQDGHTVAEAPRQRTSKWDADAGEIATVAPPACPSPEAMVEPPADTGAGPKLMPAQMPEHFDSEDKDTLLQFSPEQLLERTVIIEPLSLDVKGQELVDFLNGAVLAVTGNNLAQANSKEAPIFACTVTEEDRGIDGKVKTAELRFRTPDGANVGMKLDGLEYTGTKIHIRRPQNFVLPEDGVDPSAKIVLLDVTMVQLLGEKHYCSIFNLPDILTDDVTRDLLGQFGKVKFLKLIKDQETNKIKGYGLFEYVDMLDADLAIRALNGFVCGQSVICVRRMGKVVNDQPKAAPTCTEIDGSITQKIISNPAVASLVKQGRFIGEQPSKLVQVLNAVIRSDLAEDQEYFDIVEEMRGEASRYGKVIQVQIPRPAKEGSYIAGVGKIFVLFDELTAARKFQSDTNGRKFDKRTACAAFYPVDKFLEGKYRLSATELNHSEPKPKAPPVQEPIVIL